MKVVLSSVRRYSYAVFLTISIVFCITINGLAATYFISPGGDDIIGNGTIGTPWKTLFKATSSVTTPGDIIHVNAGTYTETEQCFLAVGVSIEGDGMATTIIKSDISGQWSLLLNMDSPQDTNGSQSISNLTLDGQYVSESINKTWIAIKINGRSNVSIHDMKIMNFRDRGVIFDGNSVTDPVVDPGHYATGNKFYNNTVLNSAENNGSYGAGLLNIGGQQGMEIYGNTMIQDQRVAFKNGWPIKYWDNGWLKGVKIYNNILTKAPYQGTYPGESGDWDFCIEFFNIEGLEIYNNTIQGSIDLNYNRKGSYAFCAWIHHNTMSRTTLNTNYESGIIFEFDVETAIVENNVLNNVSSGVQFNTRSGSIISNCIIGKNTFTNLGYGIGSGTAGGILVISEGTNNPVITNLYIYQNTITAAPGKEPWVGMNFASQEDGSATGIHIRNNIITGFPEAWLKGSSQTNMNNVIIVHNQVTGNGNDNKPLWPGGDPANYVYDYKLGAPNDLNGVNFRTDH